MTSSSKNFLAAVQSLAGPCLSDLEAEDDHTGNLPGVQLIRVNFCMANCAEMSRFIGHIKVC